MKLCTLIFILLIDLRLYKYFMFLILFVYSWCYFSFFKQSSKCIKFDILATKTEDYQLRKMLLQVVSFHYCAADIHGIYRKAYP